jgi:hypothetical protein
MNEGKRAAGGGGGKGPPGGKPGPKGKPAMRPAAVGSAATAAAGGGKRLQLGGKGGPGGLRKNFSAPAGESWQGVRTKGAAKKGAGGKPAAGGGGGGGGPRKGGRPRSALLLVQSCGGRGLQRGCAPAARCWRRARATAAWGMPGAGPMAHLRLPPLLQTCTPSLPPSPALPRHPCCRQELGAHQPLQGRQATGGGGAQGQGQGVRRWAAQGQGQADEEVARRLAGAAVLAGVVKAGRSGWLGELSAEGRPLRRVVQ